MLQNDILRRLRFALSINDTAVISLFKLVDYEMDNDYLQGMMKKEEETGFIPCRDMILALFLDALIIKNRGKQEGKAPQPLKAGELLGNNDILRKIRIALSLQDTDIIQLMQLANFKVSKSELSALFRKSDHRNYKVCGDQFLRNFLNGLTKKYRPEAARTARV